MLCVYVYLVSRLYGAPADPFKMSAFREILRTMAAARACGELTEEDSMTSAYERCLLFVPEHNFGLSVGQYLLGLRSESGNWSNPLVRCDPVTIHHDCPPLIHMSIMLLFHMLS